MRILLVLVVACSEPSGLPNSKSPSSDPDAGAPDAGATDAGPAEPDAATFLVLDRRSRFMGEPDLGRRRSLAEQPIASIERGHGGRSLGFKITLVDGTVGYFKPEQTFSAAHYYAELASYYLDRELGLGRVPPTIGRRFEWAPLRAAAGGDERTEEITVAGDGTVRGAFIWWIPERLTPISPPAGWESWVRLDGALAVTPFQRPRDWSRDNDRPEGFTVPTEIAPPDTTERAGELSDMILFDYLTTNVDRWGGDFTNVRTRGPGGPLIYLDNGAGFTAGPNPRIPLTDARLHALQRFRRETVERIRALDRRRLERRMNEDPLAPFFTERQWEQLEVRRQHLLEYVDQLAAERGAAVWI
jgi:hypothetical protein